MTITSHKDIYRVQEKFNPQKNLYNLETIAPLRVPPLFQH